MCLRYGLEVEDISHLFFRCSHSVQVWKLSLLRWDFSQHSPSSFVEWWNRISSDVLHSMANKCAMIGLASFYIWLIWNARNHLVFANEVWDPLLVANLAAARFWEFIKVQQKCKQLLSPLNPIVSSNCWSHPLRNMIKCNVDASFSKSSLLGGDRAVFRNSDGSIIQAVIFKSCSSSSVFKAKTFAFRRAVYWAKVFNFQAVCFESDAKLVVEALTGVRSVEGAVASLMVVVQQELKSFHTFSIAHVRREGNMAAHASTSLSSVDMDADSVFSSMPSSFLRIVEADAVA
ncbi:uncharacterized protein LOC132301581 [Cornus florida]|uniref:uncharacterized protein LOC132301581 n=1 Tax=Cornus florida TaxID=4283 RepID=UPI00289FC786|nr:uncharacterized protein LOC132301581 [Cornus florida]